MRRVVLRRPLVTVVVALMLAAVAAPGASARLVPPGDSPFGHTYASWDRIWGIAQAKRSLQSEKSLLAVRGNKCGYAWSQRVWLLPASISGQITVSCRIPAGMYLVFPVAGYVGFGTSPAALRAEVLGGFSWITHVELTVDGRSLRPGYVTRTPIFRANLPANNGLGAPAGTTSLMSKDYFAVFSPFARGSHTITTRGVFDVPDGSVFDGGMTYRLTVG